MTEKNKDVNPNNSRAIVLLYYTYFPGTLFGAHEPGQGDHTLEELYRLGWAAAYIPYHAPQPDCAWLIPAASEAKDGTRHMLGWNPQWWLPAAVLEAWESVLWSTRQPNPLEPDPQREDLRRRCMGLLRAGALDEARELAGDSLVPVKRRVVQRILGLKRITVNAFGI